MVPKKQNSLNPQLMMPKHYRSGAVDQEKCWSNGGVGRAIMKQRIVLRNEKLTKSTLSCIGKLERIMNPK